MKIYCLSIYEKNYDFFLNNSLTPVGLGNEEFSSNWMNDFGRKTIFKKNKNFGEYTFHYHLWKNGFIDNESDDWTGFCTYRRFWVNKDYKNPKNLDELSSILLKKTPKEWNDYDVVLANPLRLGRQKITKLIKNNLYQVLKKPSLLFRECTIKDHFNIYHGKFFIEEALKLLDNNTKKDFNIFLNNNEFNPHNLFICKSHSLLKDYYKTVFEWLFKCEEKFKHLNLETYGKRRIYGFLAERFMPFWFKKNCKSIDWPYVFFDTNK